MKTLTEKKSPFAIFNETERLVNVKSSFKTSMYITELDKTILMAINSGLVSTSALLFRLLKSRDDVIDQSTIKQRLNKLWKAEFVEKYQYTNEDGTYSANKIYTLGYRARGLLKSIGIQINKFQYIQTTLETKPTQIKRLLSAQQFAISSGENFEIGEVVFISHRSRNAKHIFRPQAIVKNTDNTLFVESVRNDDIRELTRVTEKLHRIAEVSKRMKANIEINNPIVVLVAEDSTHQDYIKAELENKLKLNNIKLKITNDLDVYYGKTELIDVNLQKPSFLDLFFIERKAS